MERLRYTFTPNTSLEKFGLDVSAALVDNFPRTFFVGGFVRDLLLGRQPTDVDLATEATPRQVARALSRAGFSCDLSAASFGSVRASRGSQAAEVTTFRRETYGASRYPRVRFVKSPALDAQRRDFTVNSLYLSAKTGAVYDYAGGLADLRAKKIRAVGEPAQKFSEDSLRALRALRFARALKFTIEPKTLVALKKILPLDQRTLARPRFRAELARAETKSDAKKIFDALSGKKILDKSFTSR